jgi:FKBP-type peptidyl-prolyl cis-trans isomerase FklB
MKTDFPRGLVERDSPRRAPTALYAAILTALAASAAPWGSTFAGSPPAGSVPAVVQSSAPPAGRAPASPPVSPAVGSYDIGLLLGSQIEHNGLGPNLSMDELIKGLKDAIGGRAITEAEREAAVGFMHEARDSLSGKNRAMGREFLERNAKLPGVVTLPSGLQYKILSPGDPHGKSPAPTDDVTVRYRTSLIDGKEIDRSDTHDRPAKFRVNSVFKGWQEAFASMKLGATWELFVPPELGYGNNSPPSIPPGSLLIYEIELLRIEPHAAMEPEAAAHGGAMAVPASPGAPPPSIAKPTGPAH